MRGFPECRLLPCRPSSSSSCVGAGGSLRVSAEGFGRVGGSAVLRKVGAVSSCLIREPGQPGASRGQSSSRVLPGRGRGCLGVRAAAAYSLASGDGGVLSKPGHLGSPAPPDGQGPGLWHRPFSSLGPGAPPPPWREACLSGLAPGRARHTETPLCTPHRATGKMNGSAVLGGRTTGRPGWEARVSELRPAGRSRLCRGMGPGSLGSLGGAVATPGPVPSRSCPSPTVARRPREVCSWGRPCSPS